MDYKDIMILLDRYFDGQTTLSEEQQLREYFSTAKNLPEELIYAQAIFCTINDIAQEKHSEAGSIKRSGFTLKRRIIAISVAATIGIICTITALWQQNQTIYCYINGKAITDPQQAMEYTTMAMTAISDNINKPAQYLEQLNALDRSLESLQCLSTANYEN